MFKIWTHLNRSRWQIWPKQPTNQIYAFFRGQGQLGKLGKLATFSRFLNFIAQVLHYKQQLWLQYIWQNVSAFVKYSNNIKLSTHVSTVCIPTTWYVYNTVIDCKSLNMIEFSKTYWNIQLFYFAVLEFRWVYLKKKPIVCIICQLIRFPFLKITINSCVQGL